MNDLEMQAEKAFTSATVLMQRADGSHVELPVMTVSATPAGIRLYVDEPSGYVKLSPDERALVIAALHDRAEFVSEARDQQNEQVEARMLIDRIAALDTMRAALMKGEIRGSDRRPTEDAQRRPCGGRAGVRAKHASYRL